jgi:hypothetical protein
MTWTTTDGTLVAADSEEDARGKAFLMRKVLQVDVDAVRAVVEAARVLDFAHKSARDN